MKKLLNTLYVTSGNRYLSLDGENVVVLEDKKEVGRIPLHNLQAIVTFGYTGASPALMGACAQRNIDFIDKEVDSLRFYYLGDKYKNKVEHIGAKQGFDVTDTLIL